MASLFDRAGGLVKKKRAAADIKSTAYEADPLDWYVEPEWCVELLFERETFEGSIADPCCGRGTIPVVANRMAPIGRGARDRDIRGYDIISRKRISSGMPFRQLDFLAKTIAADNFIMNPPYSYEAGIAEKFIRRALQFAAHKVAVLLPSKFLASQARYALFTETPIVRIYHLSTRPSMPPGRLLEAGKIKASGGKVDYCWLVWDQRAIPRVDPTTHWMRRVKA